MTWHKVNLNDDVLVKLTELGKTILQEQQDRLRRLYPNVLPEHFPIREESDGWSRWTCCELMQIFGKHIRRGLDLVIETTIYVGGKKD